MLNSKKEYIRYFHLKKYLTSQPYFVWHKIDNVSFLNENFETEETSMWEINFDEEEDLEFAKVIKNAYGKVDIFFYKQIKNEAKILKKNIFFISEHDRQKAHLQTINALNVSSIDWIVNPVFIYDDLLITPSLYRKDKKILSSLIHSSKTKLKNYIQAYFDYNVMKLLNINIEEYSFFTYSKKNSYKQVPDLKFEESNYCWTQKNGPDNKNKKNIETHSKNTIVQKIKTQLITKDAFFNCNFLEYIKKIRSAKKENVFQSINDCDLTCWGENDEFLNLFPFDKINLTKVSGNLIDKKNLLKLLNEKIDREKLINDKLSLKLIYKKENKIDYKLVKELLNDIDNKKCIWYDFEAFSLPYVIVPYTSPYQHLVFQVSVIKTNDNKIINSKNIVIDPRTINVNDFKIIIDTIYDKNYEKYIVFNKTYEISRLIEMKDLFSCLLDENEYAIYKEKINSIIYNTFDLNDFFKITKSNTKIPPIFLYELNGYSSIKKIENLITNKKISLPVMITPYKKLYVKNGLMAMNIAIQRYLETIGDEEWKEKEKELAKYCENDVKAMIMVFYFIKYLVNLE